MIINFSTPDPEDPHDFIESERSRRARQKQVIEQGGIEERRIQFAAERAARLDKYFSQHPPNGSLLSIFREALVGCKNTNGLTPRWLTYEHLEASFVRLQGSGVLTITSTEDKLGIKTYASKSMNKPRNFRSVETSNLLKQMRQSLGEALQQPAAVLNVHGCRQITFMKWQVRFFIGGHIRALGQYPFETAIRLQDVLTLHFSPYRQSASYNTSAEHAAELLAAHPALSVFCNCLENHWLSTGVLSKPGVDKTAEWRQSIEARLMALEKTPLTFLRTN